MSGWGSFLHWGERLARDIDLDEEERDYEFEMAGPADGCP